MRKVYNNIIRYLLYLDEKKGVDFVSLKKSGFHFLNYIKNHTNHSLFCDPHIFITICNLPNRYHPICRSSVFNTNQWHKIAFDNNISNVSHLFGVLVQGWFSVYERSWQHLEKMNTLLTVAFFLWQNTSVVISFRKCSELQSRMAHEYYMLVRF